MNFSAIQSFPSKLYQDTIMIHCAKINDFPDMERSKNYSQSLYNIVQNEQAEIEQEETEIVNDLRAHQQTRKIGYILKKLTLVEEESLPIQVPLWPNQDLMATLTHDEAYKQYYRTQLGRRNNRTDRDPNMEHKLPLPFAWEFSSVQTAIGFFAQDQRERS